MKRIMQLSEKMQDHVPSELMQLYFCLGGAFTLEIGVQKIAAAGFMFAVEHRRGVGYNSGESVDSQRKALCAKDGERQCISITEAALRWNVRGSSRLTESWILASAFTSRRGISRPLNGRKSRSFAAARAFRR